MPPRPAPDTPFTEEDLQRLPQWAQRKVTWLMGQLSKALSALGESPQAGADPDTVQRTEGDTLAEAARQGLRRARSQDGRTEAEYVLDVYNNAMARLNHVHSPEAALQAMNVALSVAFARYEALPVGLTVSEDGTALNWEGIPYVRIDAQQSAASDEQSAPDRGDAVVPALEPYMKALTASVAALARIANIAHEVLEATSGEVEDDD